MKKLILLVFTVACFLSSSPAMAWPDKMITMIVPFAAGGNTDIVARAIVPAMEKALNTNIIVRNIGGAAGTLGTAELARAKADGYTIGYIPTGPAILQPLLRKLPYSMDSFTPVGMISKTPYIFMVAKDSPFTSVADVKAAIRSQSLAHGSSGPGTLPHMASAAMINALGGSAKHIPDRSSAEGMKSLAGGVVQFFSDSESFLQAYDVRALGIFADERSAAFPDVPTMKEQGYDLQFSIWGGIFVPKGVPADVIAKLEKAVKAAVESPEFKDIAQKNQIILHFLDSAAFSSYCEAESVTKRELVKTLGLQPKN